MTEPDRTGYRESSDTTDGPVRDDQDETAEGRSGSEGTLTTDDDAQREDSVMRPGNVPD